MEVLVNYGDIADIECCGKEMRISLGDVDKCPVCGRSWLLTAEVVEFKEETK